MSSFWVGFEKRAWDPKKNEERALKKKMPSIFPAGLGALAGAAVGGGSGALIGGGIGALAGEARNYGIDNARFYHQYVQGSKK